MKKAIIVLAIVIAVLVSAYFLHEHFGDRGRLTTEAVYTGLERTTSGNSLVSGRDPAATLQFDPSFRYLGGQKFVLYGVADTEQHFFAEFSPEDELTSLYWIQFEEYQPDNSYSYDYDDSPARLDLDGFEFYVDTAAVKPNPKNRRAGSDGARAREFVQSKGYSYPDEFAYARIVHLTDESRRKELMIIFLDGPALRGFDPDDLKEGGKDEAMWQELEEAHLQRIRETLTLVVE